MKQSIVLSTHAAQFEAVAFKGDFETNVAKIAGYGYDGVELAIRDPKLVNADELDSVVGEYNLVVPAIGTGQAWGEERLSFTSDKPDIRQAAIERVKSHIPLAAQFNASVILGLIRGEPLNRYETDLIHTVADGMELIDRVAADNFGLLLDTFHMNIEEPSLEDSIRACGDRIFHFHVADSNRWYPGAGHLDFMTILETLFETGYDGYVSGEFMPVPDADTGAQRSIEYLKSLDVS
jgi:sugar phosphate isomerase/epimerase